MLEFLFKNNIIEGNKNKKKKKKKKKRQKRALAASNEALIEQRYQAAAAYINEKELSTQSVLSAPSYRYSDYIKSPKQIGMSGRGDMDVLDKDVNGLFSYVDLLIKGKSKAVKGGGILGPQSFVPTSSTCQLDVGGGQEKTVQRYLYNTFKPTGNIPIDGGDGVVKDARGLIPGLMENAAKLNPLDMFESFLDVNPKCMMLKMPVTVSGGGESSEERPVSVIDIGQMDPCTFKYYGNRNFVSRAYCGESFQNVYDQTENIYDKTYVEIDELFDTEQLYVATIGCIGIYVMLRALNISMDE